MAKGQSPQGSPRQQALGLTWQETSGAIQSVLSVRTFQLIVLQGLVGSIPWQAMVFFTMWLQLIGPSTSPHTPSFTCTLHATFHEMFPRFHLGIRKKGCSL